MKKMILLLLAVVCCLCLFLLMSPPEDSEIPNQTIVDEAISVSDTELWAAFNSDLKNAEKEFGKKELLVTGTIWKVSEFMLKPCISLDAQSTMDSYGVVCLLDSDDTVSETLAPGDTVTIRGICAG